MFILSLLFCFKLIMSCQVPLVLQIRIKCSCWRYFKGCSSKLGQLSAKGVKYPRLTYLRSSAIFGVFLGIGALLFAAIRAYYKSLILMRSLEQLPSIYFVYVSLTSIGSI